MNALLIGYYVPRLEGLLVRFVRVIERSDTRIVNPALSVLHLSDP